MTEEPALRRIAVGFSRSPGLREALRARLISLGRHRLDVTPQLPDSPDGLLVGGHVTVLGEADGFYECRAHYFIAVRPFGTSLAVDSAAASVPLPPPSALDPTQALRQGRATCLAEVATQIVAHLLRL